jgi:hypothetical protein
MNTSVILAPISQEHDPANELKYAINLAKIKKSELAILYVVNKSDKQQNKIPLPDIFKSDLINDLKYTEIVRQGDDVGEEILKVASELEPGLIIMSPDIFNKRKKFFGESFTGKVIENLNYPLLIIPPNTGFKEIQNIVLGTGMRENIIESVKELLSIFRNASPSIDILIFSDKTPTWHFKEDVSGLIQRIKDYTDYKNISGSICDHEDVHAGLELYAENITIDLFCLENGEDIFFNLFFNTSAGSEMSNLINKPILILPKYWADTLKKA